MSEKIKIYILIFERDRGCEEYEGNDYEILGTFRTKEECEKVIEEHMPNFHWSCRTTRDDYYIDECYLGERNEM